FNPVERALFPEINVPDQQDGNIDQHLYEAIDAKTVRNLEHILIDVSPWVQEDGLYVEQNKDHGDQVELHGKRLARVARRFHAAFVSLLFCAVWAAPSYQSRNG